MNKAFRAAVGRWNAGESAASEEEHRAEILAAFEPFDPSKRDRAADARLLAAWVARSLAPDDSRRDGFVALVRDKHGPAECAVLGNRFLGDVDTLPESVDPERSQKDFEAMVAYVEGLRPSALKLLRQLVKR